LRAPNVTAFSVSTTFDNQHDAALREEASSKARAKPGKARNKERHQRKGRLQTQTIEEHNCRSDFEIIAYFTELIKGLFIIEKLIINLSVALVFLIMSNS